MPETVADLVAPGLKGNSGFYTNRNLKTVTSERIVGFDDILQQLRELTDVIDKDLTELLSTPELHDSETKFQYGCRIQVQTKSASEFLVRFRPEASVQLPGFPPDFPSTSKPLSEAPSGSAFKFGRTNSVHPGRNVEKVSSCYCCFLPSSKSQGTGEKIDKVLLSSQECGKSCGPFIYRAWKSQSEEGGCGVRGVEETHLESSSCRSTKQSVSYDGSVSAGLKSSYPSVIPPVTGKGRIPDDSETDIHRRLRVNSSSKECPPTPGSQSSSTSKPHINAASGSEWVGPRSPCSGQKPPLKIVLDPTKYQLRSSGEIDIENRHVPHMGSQCLNVSSYTNVSHQSSSSFLVPAGQTRTAVTHNALRERSQKDLGLHKKKLEGRLNATDCRVKSEPGVPRCRSDAADFKSSYAAVSRHLSLETESCRDLVKGKRAGHEVKDENLIAWMMAPDSPEYAVPCDALASESQCLRNTKGVEKSTSFSQPLDACSQMGKVTKAVGDSLGLTGALPLRDNMVHWKSRSADPATCDTAKDQVLSHWPDELKDNAINTVPVPMGVSRATNSRPPFESTEAWAETRVMPEGSASSSHPVRGSSQNAVGFSSSGLSGPDRHPIFLKERAESVLTSWNQSAFNLENVREVSFPDSKDRNASTPPASGFMNKTSPQKERPRPFAVSVDVEPNQTDVSFSYTDQKEKQSRNNQNGRAFSRNSSAEQVSSDALPKMHYGEKRCGKPAYATRKSPFEQSITSERCETEYDIAWDNLVSKILSGDPQAVKMSQSSPTDLFSACDGIFSDSCKSEEILPVQSHISQLSSCNQGSCFPRNTKETHSSSETLKDFDDSDDISRGDVSSVCDTTNSSSCFLQSDNFYYQSGSREVFDQNNNQEFSEEENEGTESKYFGTRTGETLDWCDSEEWDSPISTLQKSIIQRPAFQRNNSVIPLIKNEKEMQNKPCTVISSQESNPDVIPLIATPRLISIKNRGHEFPGAKICYYVVSLSSEGGFFGTMIKNFIQCTMTGIEMNPHSVMRNTRQFINGLKHYLMQQRETKLNDFIKSECNKINSGEFLNLDTITERALHKCVIRPLCDHINKLFIYDFTRNGNLQMMSDGMKCAKGREIFDLSGHGKNISCQAKSIEAAGHFLKKMTETYSPLKKLECLIAAVSAIAGNNVVGGGGSQVRWSVGDKVPLRTDVLLAKLMYVLVENKMMAAEIEADYIWGLIHPSFLTGESTYYLTMFSSAITLIKKLSKSTSPATDNCFQRISSDGLLNICVPDEKHDNIWTRTLPFRPKMMTTDICKMMAYKLSITNPHEYGLYLIKDGEEIHLNDTANLNGVKTSSSNGHLLAYKRISAKFIWPKSKR